MESLFYNTGYDNFSIKVVRLISYTINFNIVNQNIITGRKRW